MTVSPRCRRAYFAPNVPSAATRSERRSLSRLGPFYALAMRSATSLGRRLLAAPQRLQLVVIDYRIRPDRRARNEYVLERILDARPRVQETIEGIVRLEPFFARISTQAPTGAPEPYWRNEWLPALDAAALYSFVASRKPKQFVEIGSGHSTRFAARARDDHGLHTRITSIDPRPRVDIATCSDVTISQPLESTDLAVFDSLEPGDVVFLDGTHRVFQNSDATVFFTEVLPRLRRDVIVGVHDVFLPDDYPRRWRRRYYSEQYLLAAWLLAGSHLDVLFPAWFACHDEALLRSLAPLRTCAPVAAAWGDGGSFWFSIAS